VRDMPHQHSRLKRQQRFFEIQALEKGAGDGGTDESWHESLRLTCRGGRKSPFNRSTKGTRTVESHS